MVGISVFKIRSVLLLGFLALFSEFFVLSSSAWAGGTNRSLGGGIGFISPAQDDINSYIDSVGAAGTKNLESGYEIVGYYGYRFNSSIFALEFRPSYFMQSTSGGGVEAYLSGFTFFPIVRIYPLENKFIKFYLQTGVGYGSLSGSLKNTGASAGGDLGFSGDTFGALGGIGAEFCFTDAHCIVVEGTMRYLRIPTNTVNSTNGSSLGGNMSTNPNGNGNELEFGAGPGQNLKTSLSGFMALISYVMHF